jgi:DNA-binding MarR family transcriptional regulator
MLSRRLHDSFGLTIPEWCVLVTVGHHGVLSPSVVGALTALDKVKVSRSAASLVNRGLVRQSQDPHDGRGRLLRLTRKGTTICTRTLPLARQLEAELANELSRTEWATLGRALGKLDAFVAGLENGEPMAELD